MWKIRPRKTRLHQGFPGPLLGWAECFYGLPLFGPDAVNIKEVLFWKKIKAM